jgi:hypothetical protein
MTEKAKQSEHAITPHLHGMRLPRELCLPATVCMASHGMHAWVGGGTEDTDRTHSRMLAALPVATQAAGRSNTHPATKPRAAHRLSIPAPQIRPRCSSRKPTGLAARADKAVRASRRARQAPVHWQQHSNTCSWRSTAATAPESSSTNAPHTPRAHDTHCRVSCAARPCHNVTVALAPRLSCCWRHPHHLPKPSPVPPDASSPGVSPFASQYAFALLHMPTKPLQGQPGPASCRILHSNAS